MRLAAHDHIMLIEDEDGCDIDLLAGDDVDLVKAAIATCRTVAVVHGLAPAQIPMAARDLMGLLDDIRSNGAWAPAYDAEMAEDMEQRAIGRARDQLRRRNLTPLHATVVHTDPMASPSSQRLLVLALVQGVQDGCRLRVRLGPD